MYQIVIVTVYIRIIWTFNLKNDLFIYPRDFIITIYINTKLMINNMLTLFLNFCLIFLFSTQKIFNFYVKLTVNFIVNCEAYAQSLREFNQGYYGLVDIHRTQNYIYFQCPYTYNGHHTHLYYVDMMCMHTYIIRGYYV